MRGVMMPCLAGALALVGCSDPGDTPGRNGVDVGAAASRAEQDIANYAATPAPTPTGSKAPIEPAATPAAASGTSAPLADSAPPEAVARRYADALAAGRYDEAWALWDTPAAPSGMSRAALAAEYGAYTGLRVAVGAPFDPDAGAGQRYISVPITVMGTTRAGARFRRMATLVLHKAADGIESDDPHAHAWRIRSSEWRSEGDQGGSVAS